MFIYTKRKEDNFTVYNLSTPRRWVLIGLVIVGALSWLTVKVLPTSGDLETIRIVGGVILVFFGVLIGLIESTILSMNQVRATKKEIRMNTNGVKELWLSK